jgi:hypothetical protein
MGQSRNRRAVPVRKLTTELLERREMMYGIAALAEGEGTVAPDFHLVDVNTTSATYNQQVSPRDFLNKVSAWYFIHST